MSRSVFNQRHLYARSVHQKIVCGSCFAAGALIHTKEGLKPIEQIQVGDWVLTQPEETGGRTYKRVTRTKVFEDSQVWTVTYHSKTEQELARAENRAMRRDCEYRLVVTPNHPFWVKGEGWVQAKDLHIGKELELADGGGAVVVISSPLYLSDYAGIAWQEGPFDPDDGELIVLRDGASCEGDFVATGGRSAIQSVHVERWQESSYYRCAVYNMEVEECHTYYAGSLGVWVHSTNCGEMHST